MADDFEERRQDIDRRHDYADFAKQLGEIKTEIGIMHYSVNDIKTTLAGDGGLVEKVGTNDKSIGILQEQLAVVNKILWLVGSTAGGAIVLAVVNLLLKHGGAG